MELARKKQSIPSFEEWLLKYFEPPETKTMYKRKDGQEEFSIDKLIKHYTKAYNKLTN